MADENVRDTSIAFRLFGHRSLFSWLFGTFFLNRSNTSGLLAVVLLFGVIVFYWRKGQVPDALVNALMLSLGFYFAGAKAGDGSSVANPRELPWSLKLTHYPTAHRRTAHQISGGRASWSLDPETRL